ncbi:hypothetical protein Nepgr_030373 [Nepenthes gracilis]|uniref:Uncharacterized protein n=1 Tax=Nepenthes gracilis TaxID=150966 RepID=A0AAD3Y5Q5_NEPGR|nr:hypothetical protein Nepgr_030373 [Nepenthes gracilis]
MLKGYQLFCHFVNKKLHRQSESRCSCIIKVQAISFLSIALPTNYSEDQRQNSGSRFNKSGGRLNPKCLSLSRAAIRKGSRNKKINEHPGESERWNNCFSTPKGQHVSYIHIVPHPMKNLHSMEMLSHLQLSTSHQQRGIWKQGVITAELELNYSRLDHGHL